MPGKACTKRPCTLQTPYLLASLCRAALLRQCVFFRRRLFIFALQGWLLDQGKVQPCMQLCFWPRENVGLNGDDDVYIGKRLELERETDKSGV